MTRRKPTSAVSARPTAIVGAPTRDDRADDRSLFHRLGVRRSVDGSVLRRRSDPARPAPSGRLRRARTSILGGDVVRRRPCPVRRAAPATSASRSGSSCREAAGPCSSCSATARVRSARARASEGGTVAAALPSGYPEAARADIAPPRHPPRRRTPRACRPAPAETAAQLSAARSAARSVARTATATVDRPRTSQALAWRQLTLELEARADDAVPPCSRTSSPSPAERPAPAASLSRPTRRSAPGAPASRLLGRVRSSPSSR